MGALARWLNLSNEEQQSVESTVGRVSSVAEFLSDAADGLKSLDFVTAVEAASPWAEAVGSSLADAIPAVKFVVKLFGKLTTQDDAALAALAFTTAYQQSVEQAVRAVGEPRNPYGEPAEIARKLRGLDDATPTDALDFSRVSLDRAAEHPFVLHADGILATFAKEAGYDERQLLTLQSEVRQRFTVHLKTLLSHGGTAEKFVPLRTLLQLGTDERDSVAALMEHAQYQRALYQEAPVFGKEVFALSHIYVDSECGVIDWGTLRDSNTSATRLDPFDEQCGGRQRLGTTVLNLLSDPAFRDAIVIQGVAGAGKSAFTQWLAAELVRQGLRPIRILLRDVRLERNRPITEALAQALRYRDESERDSIRYPRPEDPFLTNRIFNERVQFGSATICPYVLILDGWDEISISVPEGFKVRLNRMLEQIRTEYLGPERDVPVRVILTGRPSAEVSDSSFLYRSTPILTLRPWQPDDLAEYLAKLTTAVNTRPLSAVEGTGWPEVEFDRLKGAVERYQTAFAERSQGQQRSQHTYASAGSTIEILGMPLLAFLAARLLTETTGEGAKQALENPTTLYRSLLDLTCGGAGKYGEAREAIDHQFRYHGNELRHLLRSTATAMTVYGKENISYTELELRLEKEGIDLTQKVEDETSDNPLSQLIVSYYFKGGHTDLGCEFLHKSFREYLVAEDVVEVLKEFGRATAGKTLPKREPYWQDFRPSDPQHGLSRALANRLGAQWMTREVAQFVGELLTWEIERATQAPVPKNGRVGLPTDPLTVEGWIVVRDALADIWEWWTEGVHMRPRPSGSTRAPFDPPLAYEIVTERVMPLHVEPRQIPVPPRLIAIDSHLGDALFRITAIVHFQLARVTGWTDFGNQPPQPQEMWAEYDDRTTRTCQVEVLRGGRRWTLFRPTGEQSDYWPVYAARIDAAGWRPQKSFPQGCDVRGADVREIDIIFAEISEPVDWSFSNVSGWVGVGNFFPGHRLDYVYGTSMGMSSTSLSEASFRGAYLVESRFDASMVQGATFESANLTNCTFVSADWEKANFRGANIAGALFSRGDPDTEWSPP